MNKEIVLVIGGSKGIGEAIVKKIANEKRIIHFTWFQSEKNAKKISEDLSRNNLENYCHHLDISKSEEVEALVEEVGNKYKKIDVLINNAGIIRDNPLYLIDNDDWSDVLNTNLSGVFYACKYSSKFMIRNRKGKIVNISSVSARKGGRGQANYSASKGGIESFTRSLAVELAKKNITANCVSPGVIETDMTKFIRDNYSEIINTKILLKRPGKPEEVANVVKFLISEDASYINGQVINVDGGML